MSCDDLVLRKARRGLETVNILRKTAQQFAVVVEQFQKVMRRRRAEIPWPQLLAEPLERQRILLIEIEVEDRLRKWQTILLEIIIKPLPGVLKSGIPAETDTPAPAMTITRASGAEISSATRSKDKDCCCPPLCDDHKRIGALFVGCEELESNSAPVRRESHSGTMRRARTSIYSKLKATSSSPLRRVAGVGLSAPLCASPRVKPHRPVGVNGCVY